MTAHILAAELECKWTELSRESPVNRMLALESLLLNFQHEIVTQTGDFLLNGPEVGN